MGEDPLCGGGAGARRPREAAPRAQTAANGARARLLASCGRGATRPPPATTSRVVFNTTVTENNVPRCLAAEVGRLRGFGEPVDDLAFQRDENAISPTLLASPERLSRTSSPSPSSSSSRERRGRNVGLIIDLSNHDCLYTDGILEERERVHVRNVAKSVPRTSSAPPRWCEWRRAFWSRRPNDHVAIHCAYGFNRTGFVLCCYLVEMRGLSADAGSGELRRRETVGVKHERFKGRCARGTRRGGVSDVAVDEDKLSPRGDGA